MNHRLHLELQWGGLVPTFSCDAPVGSECRLTCSVGCEDWEQDHEHEMVDSGECQYVIWLENGDFDWSHEGIAVLYDGPIDAKWMGDYFSFKIPSTKDDEETETVPRCYEMLHGHRCDQPVGHPLPHRADSGTVLYHWRPIEGALTEQENDS